MSKGCPHDATGICPRDCINTICDCDWYERADATEMLDAYDVDFSVAHKETCHNCRFFLARAPKIA